MPLPRLGRADNPLLYPMRPILSPCPLSRSWLTSALPVPGRRSHPASPQSPTRYRRPIWHTRRRGGQAGTHAYRRSASSVAPTRHPGALAHLRRKCTSPQSRSDGQWLPEVWLLELRLQLRILEEGVLLWTQAGWRQACAQRVSFEVDACLLPLLLRCECEFLPAHLNVDAHVGGDRAHGRQEGADDPEGRHGGERDAAVGALGSAVAGKLTAGSLGRSGMTRDTDTHQGTQWNRRETDGPDDRRRRQTNDTSRTTSEATWRADGFLGLLSSKHRASPAETDEKRKLTVTHIRHVNVNIISSWFGCRCFAHPFLWSLTSRKNCTQWYHCELGELATAVNP